MARGASSAKSAPLSVCGMITAGDTFEGSRDRGEDGLLFLRRFLLIHSATGTRGLRMLVTDGEKAVVADWMEAIG